MFCDRIGIDPRQPISGERLREVINASLQALEQLQRNNGSREETLAVQSQLHAAARCALSLSLEGGTLEQERVFLTGNRDLVVHETTGYLVSVGDRYEFISRTHWLLNDEPLRRKMGEAGRDRIRNAFTIEQMVSRHAALYRELAS